MHTELLPRRLSWRVVFVSPLLVVGLLLPTGCIHRNSTAGPPASLN
jgi:hypothetical protein